jgi:hypothetical protein
VGQTIGHHRLPSKCCSLLCRGDDAPLLAGYSIRMKIRVYFSRSFNKKDEPVYKTLRDLLTSPPLNERFDIEIFDSIKPKSKALTQKITSDIARSDVVVGVFTRRHRIHSRQSYTAPVYVAAETAYALALQKKPVIFLEEGIEPDEMGLINGLGLEYVRFKRRQIGTVAFQDSARSALDSVLAEGTAQGTPPYVFRQYEVHNTVYPNGYTLTHFKLKVHVFRTEPLEHSFWVEPSDASESEKGLPSAAELLEKAFSSPCPYPSEPFVAFASGSNSVRFNEGDAPRHPRERNFRVVFDKPGNYDYEWMWGGGSFDVGRDCESFRLYTSARSIDRLDWLLRLHRGVKRKAPPRLIFLGQDKILDIHKQDELRLLANTGGQTAASEEATPLYTCYHFTVAPVPKGTDVAIIC